MDSIKEIVSHFKQARIAEALGVTQPTVSQAVKLGAFPASWYLVMKKLGEEEGISIPDSMFNMKAVSEPEQAAELPTRMVQTKGGVR